MPIGLIECVPGRAELFWLAGSWASGYIAGKGLQALHVAGLIDTPSQQTVVLSIEKELLSKTCWQLNHCSDYFGVTMPGCTKKSLNGRLAEPRSGSPSDSNRSALLPSLFAVLDQTPKEMSLEAGTGAAARLLQ